MRKNGPTFFYEYTAADLTRMKITTCFLIVSGTNLWFYIMNVHGNYNGSRWKGVTKKKKKNTQIFKCQNWKWYCAIVRWVGKTRKLMLKINFLKNNNVLWKFPERLWVSGSYTTSVTANCTLAWVTAGNRPGCCAPWAPDTLGLSSFWLINNRKVICSKSRLQDIGMV